MVDSGSRAAVFKVLIGVCMILLTMPRVSASTANLLVGRHGAKPAANAINFGLTNGLQMILQAHDRGNDVERLQAGMEFQHLAVHDLFGVFRLPSCDRQRGN